MQGKYSIIINYWKVTEVVDSMAIPSTRPGSPGKGSGCFGTILGVTLGIIIFVPIIGATFPHTSNAPQPKAAPSYSSPSSKSTSSPKTYSTPNTSTGSGSTDTQVPSTVHHYYGSPSESDYSSADTDYDMGYDDGYVDGSEGFHDFGTGDDNYDDGYDAGYEDACSDYGYDSEY
jgi:hypothetical protein